jgi:short-chain Z-isoprenyl diphosphate synthase
MTEARPCRKESASAPGLPRHIGVILDGNRRWARNHRLPTSDIYRAGAAKVPQFLTWCERAGIPVVTLWALSEENLRRNRQEVEPLLEIIIESLWSMAAQYPWRLRPIGRLDLLPESMASQLRAIEKETAKAPGLLANIAIAYSGRTDILMALRELISLGRPPQRDLHTLEKLLTERLSTAGLPDPDLLIRTSGETRTSGFLLWQATQAELYFTATHWPDFQEHDLLAALTSYRTRHRRFGQ